MNRTERSAPFVPTEESRRLHKDYCAELEKREASAIETFDKSVLTLSSAGLGLSLSFLKDFVVSDAIVVWALYGSWIMFTLATTTTMLSFLFSGKAHQYQKGIAHRGYLEGDETAFDAPNVWNRCTTWMNRGSAAFFFAALALTTSFVIVNLQENHMSDRNQRPTSTPGLVHKGAPVPTMHRPAATPAQSPSPPASAPSAPASGTTVPPKAG